MLAGWRTGDSTPGRSGLCGITRVAGLTLVGDGVDGSSLHRRLFSLDRKLSPSSNGRAGSMLSRRVIRSNGLNGLLTTGLNGIFSGSSCCFGGRTGFGAGDKPYRASAVPRFVWLLLALVLLLLALACVGLRYVLLPGDSIVTLSANPWPNTMAKLSFEWGWGDRAWDLAWGRGEEGTHSLSLITIVQATLINPPLIRYLLGPLLWERVGGAVRRSTFVSPSSAQPWRRATRVIRAWRG